MVARTGWVGPKRDLLQSVLRAAAVLKHLARYPRGATPKALSAELGLNLSTTYHLLNTLVAAGYVVQAPESRLFLLGPRIPYLNAGFLEALCVPPRLLHFVHALRQSTGETACLAQWHAGDVVVSAVLEDSHSVPASALHLGLADATHASAAGKMLLALAPSEHVERYLEAHDLAHRSCAAVPDALRAELDRVRAAGYAVDRGEAISDVCSAAAPIFRPAGRVREVLAVSVRPGRFEREEPSLVAAVLDISRAASYATGAGPGGPERRAARHPADGGQRPRQRGVRGPRRGN